MDFLQTTAMVFQTHPLFSKDPSGLQIMLYYDDVEVCNPLGSKAKIHKLGKLTFDFFSTNINDIVTMLKVYKFCMNEITFV